MGCALGREEMKQKQKNDEINRLLNEQRKALENEVKLLLLGAGESGKSTISKQMRLIFMSGWNEEEKLAYRSVIAGNVISSMRSLCQACLNLNIPWGNEVEEAARRMLEKEEFPLEVEFDEQIVSDVRALWKDEGIRQAFSRYAEFQLNDSAKYYFDRLDDISPLDYVPTEQDILRSRTKTTGILETEFYVDSLHFRMADVGGQRSERKKWMHCFHDVTAVIFCVALSEYDLKLYEDDMTFRMHESVKLFREICNNRWFKDTAMILFLNKKDLFEEKIKRIDLKVCFDDYAGGNDYEKAIKYIEAKFKEQNENVRKEIYVHCTCATDTSNVEVVFNAVKDIIIRGAMMEGQLGM